MAESAVNISSIQHQKPTLFELVAQESLMQHLHPSIKALLHFAATSNSTLIKSYEEFFLGINFFLQYYYLKVFNASFSEAFYGLRRMKASSGDTKSPLPPKVFAASLFFLVFTPYLNRKLSLLIERYEKEQLSGESKNMKKLERLMGVRQALTVGGGALKLVYLLSYLSGGSRFHDPVLKLSRAELVCAQPLILPGWRQAWKAGTVRAGLRLLLGLATSSLQFGAFFVQFLSWWHSDESKVRLHAPSRLPEPPRPSQPSPPSRVCPICLSGRKNEVVLLTSGYVFCYSCISNYLREKGTCPVTLLPSSLDCLVRIYSSD